MSTPKPDRDDPPDEPEADDLRESRAREIIREEIVKLLPTLDREPARRRTAAQEADQLDIEGQVEKAVAAARDKDKATAEETAKAKRLEAAEKKLAALERKPREYNRLSKVMGWVRDEDER